MFTNFFLFDFEEYDNDFDWDWEYVDEIMSNCIIYYYNKVHRSHPHELIYNHQEISDNYKSVDNKQLNKGNFK